MTTSPDSALGPAAVSLLDCFLQRQVLRFGSFTLKSGRKSPYFINTGGLHQGADLAILGAAYAETIAAHAPTCRQIFGPAYKGIPLALAAAQALQEQCQEAVTWTFDRKEAKDHGDGGHTVGAPLSSQVPLVVVDDVLTAGTALRQSLSMLRQQGVEVLCAVVAVDRQEAGPSGNASAREEIEADLGVPVYPLMRITQIVQHLEDSGSTIIDPSCAQQIRAHVASSQASGSL